MKKLYKKLAVVFGLVLLGCSVIFLPNNVTFASDLKKNNTVSQNVNSTMIKTKTSPLGMVRAYAEDNGLTFDEALKYFPKDFLYETRTPGVSYQIYSHTLNTTNWFYRPVLRMYVREDNGQFDRVYNTSINTYGNKFDGSIYVNLESSQSIYFLVDGHFYDTGTMKTKAGLNIGVGSMGTAIFEVETTKGAMAYVYIDAHFRK